LLSEQYCKDYFERADIRSCIVRPFSVYGPGLKKQLFWDIYQKSLGENPIELFGSGQESRDFVYIKDFASAIELIVKNDPFDAKAINVASGVEVSINQAANCFLKELKGKGNLVFTGKLKEGDPIVWKSNIEKLHNYGFTASYSIESGLGGYAEWLKNI
jgi:UDP-glucose 4-epimerase